MTSLDPVDLARKVRQHDADVLVLYELTDTGFKQVNGQLAEVRGRLDRIDTRLDGIDARLDRTDARLDEQFARVDEQFVGIQGRLDRLEGGQQQILELLRGLQRGTEQ